MTFNNPLIDQKLGSLTTFTWQGGYTGNVIFPGDTSETALTDAVIVTGGPAIGDCSAIVGQQIEVQGSQDVAPVPIIFGVTPNGASAVAQINAAIAAPIFYYVPDNDSITIVDQSVGPPASIVLPVGSGFPPADAGALQILNIPAITRLGVSTYVSYMMEPDLALWRTDRVSSTITLAAGANGVEIFFSATTAYNDLVTFQLLWLSGSTYIMAENVIPISSPQSPNLENSVNPGIALPRGFYVPIGPLHRNEQIIYRRPAPLGATGCRIRLASVIPADPGKPVYSAPPVVKAALQSVFTVVPISTAVIQVP